MDGALPTAYGFMLALLRALGLVLGAPSLSSTLVPARVRLGAAIGLTVAAFSGAGFPTAAVPKHFLTLIIDGAVQTALGLAAGWAVRGVMEAASGAGALAGGAMGFHYGEMINPTSGGESNALGQLLALLGLATAMALGLHRELAVWLCRSLQQVPLDRPVHLEVFAAEVIRQVAWGWSLAVRVAFPMLTAATLGHLTLGLMGRAAPQFGLGQLGFLVALIAGGASLYLVVPPALEVVGQAAVVALGAG